MKSNIDCLYCKSQVGVVCIKEEHSDKFKIMYMACKQCHKRWQDCERGIDATFQIIQVQRPKSEPSNKSLIKYR